MQRIRGRFATFFGLRTIRSLFAGGTLALGIATAAGLAAAAGPDQSSMSPDYDGLKKTVSVDQFLATEGLGGAVTSDGMTALLTAALVKDGRFIVVERTGLTNVLAEQALGQVAGTSAETAAKAGKLIGAGIIVRGAVTKFQPAASGGGVSLGGLPVGSFLAPFATRAGLKRETAVMEISLRLVDTTTGQVVSTSSAKGAASSNSADAAIVNSSGASLGADAFRATPIGQAGEQAIVKALEQIAAGMKNVPWTALVVDADAGTVYVNAGAERNVQAGMILNVYRKGREFTDPATGMVLDVSLEKIGVIQVSGVREKLSTASVVSGGAPARGDLLRLN